MADGFKALTVLINRGAGRRGRDLEARLPSLFEPIGTSLSIQTIEPAQFETAIEGAVAQGEAAVGIAGGDGSMATAAASLVGTSTPLLAIPTGTLNNFAKRIGIKHPEDAADAFARGRIDDVSVGILDDQIFLNTATFGLYADVVRFRDKLRPTLTKWPAAAVAFLFVLARLRRIEIVVQVGGEYLRRSTPLLWIGLGRKSIDRAADDASNEGEEPTHLDIVLLKPGTRINAISIFYRIVSHLIRRGSLFDDPSLEILHANQLLIHGQHRIGVTLDGEVRRFDPPVYVAVQRDALRVIVGDSS